MDNQENTQNVENLGDTIQVNDEVVENNSNAKPVVNESKLKSIVPFLILGVVAVLLGVAMVYAYNLANNDGVNETQTETNAQADNMQEEPVVEEPTVDPAEEMLDTAVEKIDSTISELDEETTFNDMDTAEFGF